jgi:hypothetical protein
MTEVSVFRFQFFGFSSLTPDTLRLGVWVSEVRIIPVFKNKEPRQVTGVAKEPPPLPLN